MHCTLVYVLYPLVPNCPSFYEELFEGANLTLLV